MGNEIGWIVDAYVEGDYAVFWIKTLEGKAFKVKDRYSPRFYILPKSLEDGERVCQILSEHPSIKNVLWTEKYTDIRDRVKSRLLQVTLYRLYGYRKLLESLKLLSYVKQMYNIDLLHIQKHIFENVKIAPTSKVRVEFDKENLLEHVERVDDEREIFPPPFKTLYFEIEVEKDKANYIVNPVKSIKAIIGDKVNVFRGKEEYMLEEFSNFIEENDPDIIVCPECDSFTFPYLVSRARFIGLNFNIGREDYDNFKARKPYWAKGRISLDKIILGNDFNEFGVCGLVERSRFSLLPPTIAGRWTANMLNDSRVCFELVNSGYVIPEKRGNFEYVRKMSNLVERDKGAIILPPKIGLHENVAELDFESQFPNIIVKYGISYETVGLDGIEFREDAILPNVIKSVLERRLYFKRLRKNFPKESIEYRYCEQRQSSLKMILVTLYGTSGCCWNRFGNVLAFEEINRRSRELMVKSKNFVQEKGFEIVYADCDSLFIKKENSLREDYETLAKEVSSITGMPVALDHHYKFLALLPLKSDPSMEAQKHYYGITFDEEIVTRGIEARRHDTPKFVKEFQTNLIKTLFNCNSIEEVETLGYNRALKVIEDTIRELANDRIRLDDLTVSKFLRKPLQEYKSRLPHVSAAKQMEAKRLYIRPGNVIKYVYTDSDHHNPLYRIRSIQQNEKFSFDKTKYADMILEAAETILSIFGFNKQFYKLKFDTRWFK